MANQTGPSEWNGTSAGGSVVRVAAIEQPPYVFVSNASSDGAGIAGVGGNTFSGYLVDLLKLILAQPGPRGGPSLSGTGFKYELYNPLNASGGGKLGPNGSWDGMMGELTEDRADIVLFPLTVTLARTQAVSISHSYYDSGLALLTRLDRSKASPTSFLRPFSAQLWVLVLGTVFIMALLQYLLDTLSKRARRQREEDSMVALPHKREANVDEGWASHMLESWMAMVGQSTLQQGRSWSVKILYVCYSLFCLIALSSFTANLTAYLTVGQLDTSITRLADLRKNFKFGVLSGGATVTYFLTSADYLVSFLAPQLGGYPDVAAGVAALRNSTIKAFITDYPTLLYQSHQPPCDMVALKDFFGPGNLGLGMRQGSPHLAAFNYAILSLIDDGSMAALKDKWLMNTTSCRDVIVQPEMQTIGIVQFKGIFMMLAGAVLIAFVWAGVEVMLIKSTHKWPELKDVPRNISTRIERSVSIRIEQSKSMLSRSSTLSRSPSIWASTDSAPQQLQGAAGEQQSTATLQRSAYMAHLPPPTNGKA